MILKQVPYDDPVYSSIPFLQRPSITTTIEILESCLEAGLIDTHNLSKVLDFGCGFGGPSYAMAYNGADVTAVDKKDYCIEYILNNSIFPRKNLVLGDGLDYMASQPEGSFDMVTAFMLGPIGPHPKSLEFVARFYQEAERVINDTGRILICSDSTSIRRMEDIIIKKRGRSLPSNPNVYIFGKG